MKPVTSFGFTAIRAYGTRTHVMPRTHKAHKPPPKILDPLNNNPNAGIHNLEDDDLTFIHRPPPTAPTPYSTTLAPSSPLLRPPSSKPAGAQPPLLRPSAYVQGPPRVTPEQLAEIRRLRRLDPEKYTRGKLSKMFNCTPHFVSLVAALRPSKRKELKKAQEEEHESFRKNWGEKTSLIKELRLKRREFW
jgi:Mitochondrial ribosomal protein subunit L20